MQSSTYFLIHGTFHNRIAKIIRDGFLDPSAPSNFLDQNESWNRIFFQILSKSSSPRRCKALFWGWSALFVFDKSILQGHTEALAVSIRFV